MTTYVLTNVILSLCSHLWHSIPKSEGNIRAVALRVTSRPYGWAVSGPAFTLWGAGLHETLILTYRHTELTQRALSSPGAMQAAGFRATPQLTERNYVKWMTERKINIKNYKTATRTASNLGTGNNALITVTGVAIFSPLCAIQSKATSDHTWTTRD